MKQFALLVLVGVALISQVQAQVGNIRLNEQLEQFVLDSINADPSFHTAIKPYRKDQVIGYNRIQQKLGVQVDTKLGHYLYNKEWITRSIRNKKFHIRPIITTELGPLLTQGLSYESERDGIVQDLQIGANLYSDINSKWTIDLSYVFTNWSAPVYLQTSVDSTQVIPKWGEYKNGDKYSAAGAQFIGEISYAPSKNFHFQVGRGKHFFGDGYRSLLLSDNAPFYNYFRSSVDLWRFKYIFLFAGHKDINPALPDQKYSRKYTATHFLSYNVTKWLNLNFFETIVQQATDSASQVGLDVNYLNPVAFFRPIEFNSGSPDNALLGIGGKIRISASLQLYGQAVVDELIIKELTANRGFWGNKYGLQAGLKWRPTKRFRGFAFRGEVNLVRPFTYSHGPGGNVYGSLHQPLAHPLGSNFIEALAIFRYRVGRFNSSLKVIMADKGLNQNGLNYGSDIYVDYSTRAVPDDQRIIVDGWEENDFGHQLRQGLRNRISYTEIKLSYLLHPKLGLALELGASFHSTKNDILSQNHTYAFFGLRTYLFNNSIDY